MKKLLLIASAIFAFSLGPSADAQSEPVSPKSSRPISRKIIAAVELYTKKQDSDGAIKGLNSAIVKEPKNFYANAWLGFLHMEAGSFAEAILPLEVAHGEVPSDLGVLNNLALVLDKSGNKARAFEVYLELDAARPRDPAILNKLGVMSLNRNDTDVAIKYLEEADRIDPGEKGTTSNLASAYEKGKQSEKAKAAYERLIGLKPDNETMVTALSWLGFNAIQANQFDVATGYLERALTLRENDLEVLNNLAMAYGSTVLAQDSKALDMYRRMVAMNPNLYEPWYNLGVLYLKANKADEAVEANLNALKRKPNEAFALNNLGRAYEMQHRFAMAGDSYAAASTVDKSNLIFAHNAGAMYAQAKLYDKAVVYISRALNLGDEDLDMMLILGDIYARQGKTVEAVSLLEKASFRVTDRADLWFNLGVMKEKLGKKTEAEDSYKKCLIIRPDDIDANTNLALLLLGRGDWKAATPILEKVTGINSSSIDAKINLAAAYYHIGKPKEAVEIWKTVVRMAPLRTDVRLNLANALWALEQFENAYQHFAIATKESPEDAQAQNGVGLWYLRESKNADAEKAFRNAIKADPKYMPPYNNLAVTLERLNRRKEAIVLLERALKVDPNFVDAQKNLKRMKSAEN